MKEEGEEEEKGDEEEEGRGRENWRSSISLPVSGFSRDLHHQILFFSALG